MSDFIAELRELGCQVIVHEPVSGRDAYGAPTYGPAVTYYGRAMDSDDRISAQGQPEVLATGKIIILDTPTIKIDDRVYVSGAAAPYPVAKKISQSPDETGANIYTSVLLGSAT